MAHKAIGVLYGLVVSMAKSESHKMNMLLSSKNIFYAPKSGKVTLVDWGQATEWN
jgi:hypothetical protein